MNTDIRISVDFWMHPKTGRLIREAGLEGVRSLQILWSWVARNRPDGVLSGMDADDIEFAADWRGAYGVLYGVLTAYKWVDVVDGVCVIHDWHQHNPWAAEVGDRSDAARLSRLCRDYPAKGKELKEAGVTGITSEQYREYKKELTTVQRPYNDRTNEGTTNRSTPAPAPAPAPAHNAIALKDKQPPAAKKFDPVSFRPAFIPEGLWLSFLENRKFKKIQNSELALTTACNQLLQAVERGYSIENCIGSFVEGKWTRFKVEYMDNLGKGQQQRERPKSLKEQQALELLGHGNFKA